VPQDMVKTKSAQMRGTDHFGKVPKPEIQVIRIRSSENERNRRALLPAALRVVPVQSPSDSHVLHVPELESATSWSDC
jgi:hypothetical protein